MPGRNGIGPRGEGPLTGRRWGNCRGEAAKSGYAPGFYGYRRGLGRGFGPGTGRRFGGQGHGFDAGRGPGFFGWGSVGVSGGAYEGEDNALEARERYLEAELNRVRSLRERKPGDEA